MSGNGRVWNVSTAPQQNRVPDSEHDFPRFFTERTCGGERVGVGMGGCEAYSQDHNRTAFQIRNTISLGFSPREAVEVRGWGWEWEGVKRIHKTTTEPPSRFGTRFPSVFHREKLLWERRHFVGVGSGSGSGLVGASGGVGGNFSHSHSDGESGSGSGTVGAWTHGGRV